MNKVAAMRASTVRVGWAIARSAAACMWFAAIPAAHGQDRPVQAGSAIRLQDIVLDWRQYEGQSITVDGQLQCRNEFTCYFVSPQYVRTEIAVDIAALPGPQKLAIVTGCHVSPCAVAVRGEALRGQMLAEEATGMAGLPMTTQPFGAATSQKLARAARP